MNKNLRNSILAIAAVGMISASCTKWLDTTPTSSVAESDIFQNTESAMMAINGIHRITWDSTGSDWYSQGAYPSFCVHLAAMTDDFVFTYANVMFQDDANWVRHRDLTHKYKDINYYWKTFYKIINNANKVLFYIDNIPGSDDTRNYVKGQALAYRAFAHHNLVQAWGGRYVKGQENKQLGVILRTSVENGPKARSTVEECYAQIIADYTEAIECLDKTSISGAKRASKMHIDKWVARGLKARACLCMGNWTEAAKLAQEVIDSKTASLSETIYTDTDKQNRMSDQSNSEWIWGTLHTDDGEQYGSARNWHDLVSNGTASYNTNSPRAINCQLYWSIPESDVRKNLWVENPWEWLKAGKPLYLPKDGGGAKAMFQAQKFLIDDSVNTKVEKDVPYMRLSEMILTAAEAYARDGQEGKAQKLVGELGHFRDKNYPLVSSKTGAALIDEILWQRRVDLWGEVGDRWYTLKRLNVDMDRGNKPGEGYSQGGWTKSKAPTEKLDPKASNFNMYGADLNEETRHISKDDPKWQWYIPSQELEANALAVQNN